MTTNNDINQLAELLKQAGAVGQKAQDQLSEAKQALRDIVSGCESRLRGGRDAGDESTLAIAKDALKRLA
jgi:DNA-binding ferritin-like protein